MFERLPVCVFSFARPDYLRRTLECLRVAMAEAVMSGPVLLFQDGAYNPFSGQTKAAPERIAACRQVFLDVFPHGLVMQSEQNLGIALNIERGERWVFETMGYECGLFFEDDMEVAPAYFRAMRGLHALSQTQQRIGMFAAYGSDIKASLDSQRARRREVGRMHHNWAFGLTRVAWQARQGYTRAYISLLKDCDYRDRPADAIARWYARLGWPPLATNQDLAKSVALNTLGFVRVASGAVLARYIGEEGQHYTPKEFERLGFGGTQMMDEADAAGDWAFDPLPDALVDEILQRERAEFMRQRLPVERLLASSALMETARVLAAVGMENVLHVSAGTETPFVASVSGMHRDRWAYPEAAIAFRPEAALRRVKLTAIAAQHLPPGTTVCFSLNGVLAAEVPVDAGKTFEVSLDPPPALDGLEKVLTSRCSVALDPFTAGFNADRRPISFLLLSLTLTAQGGAPKVIQGEALVPRTSTPVFAMAEAAG